MLLILVAIFLLSFSTCVGKTLRLNGMMDIRGCVNCVIYVQLVQLIIVGIKLGIYYPILFKCSFVIILFIIVNMRLNLSGNCSSGSQVIVILLNMSQFPIFILSKAWAKCSRLFTLQRSSFVSSDKFRPFGHFV